MAALTRRLHFTEAVREAEERGEIVVNVGDIVYTARWGNFAMVTDCGDDHADARLVCIVPPRGYGKWGGYRLDATAMRYMGWIEDFTDEELDGIADEVFERLPEVGCHAYALKAARWRKFDAAYWDWLRKHAV